MRKPRQILTYSLAAFTAAVMALTSVPAGIAGAQSAPATPPSGSSVEQRIAQRKAERNIKLTERDQKRLTSRCVAAQADIRSLQQKTAPVVVNRAETYQRIDAKLWVVTGKLKLAKKDTFNLEKQRIALAGRVDTFLTTAKNYQQALDDAAVINCQADVIAFKSMVDTARIYRTQLRDQSEGIRGYILNDIKQSLSAFASELQAKPNPEGEN